MAWNRKKRDWIVHLLFMIGVAAKGVDGALELLGAIVLYLVPAARIPAIAHTLMLHEINEDPQDFLVGIVTHSLAHLSVDAKLFGVLFLLGHGAVKVGLVVALLRRYLWAYPAAIAAFTAFVAYQITRYASTHSPWLLVISAIDVVVIGLTWLEYGRLQRSEVIARERV